MQPNSANRSLWCPLAALVLFALAAILAPAPRAFTRAQYDQGPEKLKVVAHLDLHGIHAKQMFVRTAKDHYYLYLQRPHKHAFAVVDVTRPDKPVLVESAALAEPSGTSVTLPPPGSVLAISVRSDSTSPAASADADVPMPTETVGLMDLSDPKHPKVLKTFEKVTAIATDDGRKLVFVVNNEGLWIVSHHQEKPLPLCSSDAEISALPTCE